MKAFFLAFKWAKVYQYNHKFLKNKLVAQAIVKTLGILGNLLNREEEMTAPNVMNSFSGARGTLVAGLTALALAFTPAAFADHGVAHPPNVQHVASTTQTSASQEVKFGQIDVRGRSETGIMTAAVASSINAPSLVVRTEDRNVWRIAYMAAKERAESGKPTALVLAGGNENTLEFWAGGLVTSKINGPSVTSGRLEAIIREGFDYANLLGFQNTQASLGVTPQRN